MTAFETGVEQLRAIAEPSRLRIVRALAERDLAVGDVCRVLDQSQPRVSRHLKILNDAGLIERHAEGSRAVYRPARSGDAAELIAGILAQIDDDDPALVRDSERLEFIRVERAAEAEAFFTALAEDWDDIRPRHVADTAVEKTLVKHFEGRDVELLLDVGTGTGRILELFAPDVKAALGIDISASMVRAARSRLDEAGHKNCEVRLGSVYELDVPMGGADAAILHHVLHFLDEPARAIAECARALGAGGELVIVDFAPHADVELSERHGHHHLGFTDVEVADWCSQAGLTDVEATHLKPKRTNGDDHVLITTLWTATKAADSHTFHRLENAS